MSAAVQAHATTTAPVLPLPPPDSHHHLPDDGDYGDDDDGYSSAGFLDSDHTDNVLQDASNLSLNMSTTLPPQPPVIPAARHKPSRSATNPNTVNGSSAVPPPSSAHPPTRPRRSLSEDSSSQDVRVARQANTRTKSHGAASATPRYPTATTPAKEKPSQHADFIDGLDITGTGGMFHHDGPFDACAPSFNRSKGRSPMYAFNDGTSGAPHNVPVYDKRLSPLAQATIAAMANSDGPYASASLMPPTSPIRTGDIGGGSSVTGHSKGSSSMMGPTRKMTLTEAWGRAEPEPFEEFSAGVAVAGSGAGSARSSLDGTSYEQYQRRTAERPANGRRGESLDLPNARRNKIPPPQPIILPGARSPNAPAIAPAPASPTEQSYASDYTGGTGKPMVKRTKSLMQRIRNMRENPNVPVPKGGGPSDIGGGGGGYYSEGAYTPREERWQPSAKTYAVAEEPELPSSQYHRQQQRRDREQSKPRAASRPRPHRAIPESPEEPFVLVDNATTVAASREKALPPPPGSFRPPPQMQQVYDEDGGYFGGAGGASGVGRKPSLYQKMKGAVVGGGHGRGR